VYIQKIVQEIKLKTYKTEVTCQYPTMAADIAESIVEMAEKMQQKKKEDARKNKRIYIKEHVWAIDIMFAAQDVEDEDPEIYNWIFLKMTKYNDKVYWVAKEGPDEEPLQLIDVTNKPRVLDILCRNIHPDMVSEHERRLHYIMVLNFREKHKLEDGKEHACFRTPICDNLYDKDTPIKQMIGDGIDMLKEIVIV
jgi:hypothetical protein